LKKLTDIKIDKQNRLVITGRARIRPSPEAPTVENGFKIRTKVGTRNDGQVIRLTDTEIAVSIECPKRVEAGISAVYKTVKLPAPKKPEPINIFVPLVKPPSASEKDGFNMGPDNIIKHIEIKDGALRFELSTVLRPGRFLGSHYLAVTFPNRTFILTIDRLKDGIRNARKNKRNRQLEKQGKESENEILSSKPSFSVNKTQFEESIANISPRDNQVDQLIDKESQQKEQESPDGNFFTRFVRGYVAPTKDELDMMMDENIKEAVTDFFGSQNSTDVSV